jgi:hypothetical protein
MFGFDPTELKAADPERFKRLRQIAKALNFGIAYGSGAAALGRTLSSEGTPTTTDEAADLLARYRQTYPGTAAWAEARIAEIRRIAEDTAAIDWPLTMRLARGFRAVDSIRREFRQTEFRRPNADEIAERHPDRITHPDLIGEIEWLFQYSAAVALVANGEPFRFSARTLAGRRQQFELHTDRLFVVAAMAAIRSTDPGLLAVRRRFEREHGTDFGADPTDARLERIFEDRQLRRLYIEAIAAELGDEVAHAGLARAARERVQVMVNAWRNAPIQGGVADIMLAAYADLHSRLQQFPTARPVQTVHDSVVIECDEVDAEAVADRGTGEHWKAHPIGSART